MTPADELIARTRKLGIDLWVSDGMLNYRAPRAAMSAELQTELKTHKPSIIEALSGPRFERAPYVSAIDIPDAFVPQWNRLRAGDIGVGYTNVTNMTCRFRCPIDRQALERALHSLVTQHNALRCRLSDEGSGPRLVFDCVPELTVVDLSRRGPGGMDWAITEAAQNIAWQPFPPGACLFRPFLLELPSSETAIGFVVHHFIVDGWSFAQIPGYWMLEYERQLGRQPTGDVIQDRLQYSDFLLEVSNWSKTRNFQRRLDYWREALRGVIPSRLPPDHAVELDAKSFHRGQPVNIDADRVPRLATMAASLGVTLSDVLLAGVVLALHRELGSPDICVHHVWHGRDDPKLIDMIGDTRNPLMLRIRVNPESHLRDIARQVHQVSLEAISNHVPYFCVEKLLNETGTNAFVQTNFRILESPDDPRHESATAPSSLEPIHVWNPEKVCATPRHMPAHDINLSVVNGTVVGQISYLESIYEDETIRRFIRGFDQALAP